VFLAGFIPTENMKFRDYGLTFRVSDKFEEKIEKQGSYKYPEMVLKRGPDFELTVQPGTFRTSEIIVLLGENGTGKTTLVEIFAGKHKSLADKIPEVKISFKPQTIKPKFDGTVQELFITKLGDRWRDPNFRSLVLNPLNIDDIIDNTVK